MNGCFAIVGGEHTFNIHLLRAFTFSSIAIMTGMRITLLIYIERCSSRSYMYNKWEVEHRFSTIFVCVLLHK